MKRLTTLTTVVLRCLGSNLLTLQKQQLSFKIPAENSNKQYTVSQNVDVEEPNQIVRLFDVHNTAPNNTARSMGLSL